MINEELARKTAELLYHPVDVDLNKAIILSALQEAVNADRELRAIDDKPPKKKWTMTVGELKQHFETKD